MSRDNIDGLSLNKPIISIIVPIYNSGKYLDKCLVSIKKQSYSVFEVLLIDDGSQDCSLSICHKYCENDQRFKYFYIANGGVSRARNYGLQMAKGEYVCFVDSDDYVDNEYLEVLLHLMKNVDMAVCGYYKANSSGDIIASSLKGERISTVYSAEKYGEVLFKDVHGYQGYIWNKIFKSRIIRENNILFSEKIYYNEDRLFVLEYLVRCQNISYNDLPLYRYVIHEESAMGQIQKFFSVKIITELDAFQKMQDILKDRWKQAYSLCLLNSIFAGYSLEEKCWGNQEICSYVNGWLLKITTRRNISRRDKLRVVGKFFRTIFLHRQIFKILLGKIFRGNA